ncbi:MULTISPECIES: hypothetical protein [unclassified Chryseobacterium]|uniref:hypothetical protein n=1 Tax=unclassified Chryseobacterium TaxID=2593645 RepID=UPI000F44C0B6|nr:hypothetical protein [Chryseobacterium sp. G0240]ROI06753.1 hypothetical protein EGI16_02275 [Chryseobacterium sp. G0240]
MNQGKPLTTDLLSGAVDLQVVHPPVKLINGRPEWLLKMNRHSVSVPQNLLPESGIRLIQAFVADSPEDARPIDQVLIMSGKKPPVLMLPDLKVRYDTQDFPNQIKTSDK